MPFIDEKDKLLDPAQVGLFGLVSEPASTNDLSNRLEEGAALFFERNGYVFH
jgi:hypothetical protein